MAERPEVGDKTAHSHHEDLKAEGTHQVAERGIAATDM